LSETVAEQFSAEWLELRERFDRPARDRALIGQFVELLPPAPRLIDVGAGAGSLFRMLAPAIGGPQSWVFADSNEQLVMHGLRCVAAWAAHHGLSVSAQCGALSIDAPKGEWRVVTRIVRDPGDPSRLALHDADAVVCSALLDLVSGTWLDEFARQAAARPVYAGMTIDGRDQWLPPHSADAGMRRGFMRHLHRDKGAGRALGTGAAIAALRALQAAGYQTRSAPADWRIPPHASRMLRALIEGRAAAAVEAEPASRERIAAWASDRLNQVMAARLAIRIGHRDILAW
jgi:hypothetical protein